MTRVSRLCATTALAFAAFTSAPLAATVLYDNGPIVNSDGLSVMTPQENSIGFGSSITLNIALADDFTVTGRNWTIGSIDFYAYQTLANGFTFTQADWQVVRGTDVSTASVVASGLTSVTNNGLIGYRVQHGAQGGRTRAIYRLNADMADFSLAAGSYFLIWKLAGTAASGPFVPPVLSTSAGNGFQRVNGGTFVGASDQSTGQRKDFPFTINAAATPAIPEPATWAMMIGGFAFSGAALRRKRAADVVFA